jgi:hypothetical protein
MTKGIDLPGIWRPNTENPEARREKMAEGLTAIKRLQSVEKNVLDIPAYAQYQVCSHLETTP